MSEHNEIDLGATEEERYGGMGISAPSQVSDKSDKKLYPSFHYSGRKELDLPEDGKMTVEYCKTSEKSIVRDGEHFYECDIEVRKICEVEGDDEDEKPEKVADILDGLMEKLQKERE